MDCFCWARKEKGTAPFPKAKEYQKLKVGAFVQEESEIDLYTTDDESGESDSELDVEQNQSSNSDGLMENEEMEEAEEQHERNLWDSDSSSSS